MITQIITFQLRDGVSLAEPKLLASIAILRLLELRLADQGAEYAYYGQFIEKPEIAIILVNWDSVDDSKVFMSSLEYDSHLDHLRPFIDSEQILTSLHVPFSPSDDPSPALGANTHVGVTEVVFFYFPFTLTANRRSTIMSSVDKMRPVMDRSESIAIYDEWALETYVPNRGPSPREEETCQVYVNSVGWVDVEAHMRMQVSDDFRDNAHHLMGVGELRYTEFFHVKLQKVY